MTTDGTCSFFWGSHGCDLPAGPHVVHECGQDPTPEELAAIEEGDLHPMAIGRCCLYDETADPKARVKFMMRNEDGHEQWGAWTEYGEGWRQ